MSTVATAHPRSRGENVADLTEQRADRGSSPLTRGKPPPRPLTGRRDGLIPAHAGKTTQRSNGSPNPTAHPRSRGENPPTVNHRLTGWGSSPLTRGKRLRSSSSVCRGRLIPAHAGKTRNHRWWVPCHRAHPRSRGENPVPILCASRSSGSSPLTRGKHGRQDFVGDPARLIPAHAGKTWGCGLRATPRGAHPRSRGENRTASYAPVV